MNRNQKTFMHFIIKTICKIMNIKLQDMKNLVLLSKLQYSYRKTKFTIILENHYIDLLTSISHLI